MQNKLGEVEDRYATQASNSATDHFDTLLHLGRLLARSDKTSRAAALSCDFSSVLSGDKLVGNAADLTLRITSLCPVLAKERSIRRVSSRPSPEESYKYDPVLVTIAAGLESRKYRRHDREWKTLRLSFGAPAVPYFEKSPSAHFRKGNQNSHKLFLIAGSSYSTWRGGSWTNKTVAVTEREFPGAHFLALPGFLTPEFLAARPRFPELTGELTAQDLYPRIAASVERLQRSGALPDRLAIGLIGFSGGANLALSLLAEDSKTGQPLRFGLGAIAFSPIVDLEGTFDILDRSSAAILASGFPPTHGLTTFTNMMGPFIAGFSPGNLDRFFGLMKNEKRPNARAHEFVSRFYREFQLVDLQNVKRAPYQEITTREPRGRKDSFRTYYGECVMPLYRRKFNLGADLTFAEYAKFGRLTAPIQEAPVYLVLADDDPVLVRSSISTAEATQVPSVLKSLRARSNFRVFTPNTGAHLGYMIDSGYLRDTIRTFFSAAEGQ